MAHEFLDKSGLSYFWSKIKSRITSLENSAHSHSNKPLLDTYTQTNANLADAVTKKHSHSNLSELEKIESGDVDKWNSSAVSTQILYRVWS